MKGILMRYIIFVLVLICSCSSKERYNLENVCEEFCDNHFSIPEDYAQVRKCTFNPLDVEDFFEDCNSSCNEVAEFVVDDEFEKSVLNCLICINDKFPEELIWESMVETRDLDCINYCSGTGPVQFFGSFYVPYPPEYCYVLPR